MATKNYRERLVSLVGQSPTTPLHLVVGDDGRGMVLFACEHAPLLTFQTQGLLARCPICGTQNPLKGER